jgi:hypothetical protein
MLGFVDLGPKHPRTVGLGTWLFFGSQETAQVPWLLLRNLHILHRKLSMLPHVHPFQMEEGRTIHISAAWTLELDLASQVLIF